MYIFPFGTTNRILFFTAFTISLSVLLAKITFNIWSTFGAPRCLFFAEYRIYVVRNLDNESRMLLLPDWYNILNLNACNRTGVFDVCLNIASKG